MKTHRLTTREHLTRGLAVLVALAFAGWMVDVRIDQAQTFQGACPELQS